MGRSWRWIVEASIDADAIELHDLLARDRAFLKGRPRKIGDRTTEQAVCAMAACDTYRDDTSQADVQEARAAAEVALKQLATCGPWMMARTRAAIVCLLAYWRVNDLIDRSRQPPHIRAMLLSLDEGPEESGVLADALDEAGSPAAPWARRIHHRMRFACS